MNANDKYTIQHMNMYPQVEHIYMENGLIMGDIVDLITGDIIVGPYCVWPKT